MLALPDAARAASAGDHLATHQSRASGRHHIPQAGSSHVSQRQHAESPIENRRRNAQYSGKQKVDRGLANARKSYGAKPR